ncbi:MULTISPECIES: hypothetical protein [unclassified Streptomyces]|uniref:hypothetical protein n=1 Tax=unclassified Streptomyces TaxID=2593676 RepID=UPI0036E9D74A
MSGDKPKNQPHQADQERVQDQNGFTDIANSVSHAPKGNFVTDTFRSVLMGVPVVGDALRGRTNFEGHRLNDMVDLVQRTKPEDLENAGKALWDARDAIKAAASELSGHIDRVQWVGESGEAFRTWGRDLVKNTHKLGDFADAAGTQITAAGAGLASVRSSMPPRDTRISPKGVDEIPTPARVETNHDYTAAVQAEKHRQEAINQMNRLSSFYAVSGEFLQDQHPPTFGTMPDVGVPKPNRAYERFNNEGSTGQTQQAHSNAVATGHDTTGTTTGHVRTDGVVSHPTEIQGSISKPDLPVGTEIDSVDTLPTQTTHPVIGTPPPTTTTGPSVPGGVQPTGPFATGLVKPMPSVPGGRGLPTGGGTKSPLTAQGRAGGQAGVRGPGQGTSNPMGRATSTGQAGTKGGMPAGRPTTTGRGISGGTPRAGGTASGRPTGMGQTGAGRSNGVVGGRPTPVGGASGKTGPKVPRGTVIGGEGAAGSRNSTGGIGQRGVIGAPSTAKGTGVGRSLGGGSPDGVTGTPQGRNSAARAGRAGFTSGGSGLVRGPGGNGPAERDEGEGTQRPDHLVEDEQTHLPDKPRRDVPPVID